MSATPLIPDTSAFLTRSSVSPGKESGTVQTRLPIASTQEAEEGKKEGGALQDAKPKSITNVNLLGSGLEFDQDRETGLTIIKMYDRETGKMVRQLPPEETLAFLRRLAEDQKGVLVSKKL